MLPDGDRLAQVVRLESGVIGQERRYDALVLARARSCRSSRRACRRGARRPRPRAGSRPGCARAARAGRRSCASARRGGWRACRGPSRAGRRARGRRPPARARAAASAARTSTQLAPIRCAVRASAAARPRWRSTATSAPAVLHQRGEVGRLAAGRGAQVEHALARARVEQPRDGHRRARLRHEQPSRHSGAPWASKGASSTSPSGRPGAGVARHRQPRGQLGGGRAQRVGAQRGLGGLVVGGHQRPRGRRARASPTTARRSTRDASGAARRPAACPRAAPRPAPRASRAARRSTALTSPAPPRESSLASCTDSPTAAWAGTRSR